MTPSALLAWPGLDTRAGRSLLRLVTVLAVVAALLSVSAGAAVADTTGSATSAHAASCSVEGSAAEQVSGDDLLPVNRWSPATNNFHSRTDGVLGALYAVQRDVGAGMFMSIGNGLWSVTSDITLFASRFCIVDSVGTTVDATAGDLMSSLVEGGLAPYLVALLLAALGYGLWSGLRRGGIDWRQIALKLGAAGLLVTLMVGAQATDPDRGTFGAGSPGWWLTTVNDTVSDVGAAPALFAARAETVGQDGMDPMSCESYVVELKQIYQARYSGSLTSAATSMPIVLNGIWEETGMAAWRTAQFGQNPYGDFVYCRFMDQFANVPVGYWPQGDDSIPMDPAQRTAMDWYARNGSSSTLAVLSNIGGVPRVQFANSIAFMPVNDITRDVSIVAWAVCQPDGNGGWSYRTTLPGSGEAVDPSNLRANAEVDATDAGTQADSESTQAGQTQGGKGCAGWWTERAVAGTGGFDDGGSAFDWQADPEKINNELTDAELDFMSTLHGYEAGPSTSVAFWYMVSSLCIFVVFGFVSLGIILAKFMLVVMMVTVVGIILIALFPKANTGEALGKYGKSALGLMILTAMTTAIFSILGQLTELSMNAGMSFFEEGSIGAMFWSAISPVVAVLALHWGFKKANIASPFTLQGVKAWGGAAPAIGGAVGGAVGAGLASRLRGRAEGAARSAGSATLSKVTGGRIGQPMRTPRKGAGGLTRVTKSEQATASTTVAAKDRLADSAGVAGMAGAGAEAADTGDEQVANPVSDARDSRAERRRAQVERDDALLSDHRDEVLATFGKGEIADLSSGERRTWLRDHRKGRLEQAKRLDQAQWDEQNASSWRAQVHARQRLAQSELGDAPTMRGRLFAVVGGTGDIAQAKLDKVREIRRKGGVAGLLRHSGDAALGTGAKAVRNIKSGARTVARVGGKTAAVGALGATAIALGPVGMASAGGVMAYRAARRARGTLTAARDGRTARQNAALDRLVAHEAHRRQQALDATAPAQLTAAAAQTGTGDSSAATSPRATAPTQGSEGGSVDDWRGGQ